MLGIKEILGCFHKANKAEIEEIKGLTITQEDKNQSAVILNAIAGVLAAYGVPTTAVQNDLTKAVIEYCLRDLKDGLNTPSKLLTARIIKEIKKAKADKA